MDPKGENSPGEGGLPGEWADPAHLDGWVGVSQMRHSRQRTTEKNQAGEESWPAFRDGPSCHLPAGRMPGGLACCVHTDCQPILLVSVLLPTPNPLCTWCFQAWCISGSQGSNCTLLSCFPNLWCSRRLVPLLFHISSPTSIALHCKRIWKYVFYWWPLPSSLRFS